MASEIATLPFAPLHFHGYEGTAASTLLGDVPELSALAGVKVYSKPRAQK